MAIFSGWFQAFSVVHRLRTCAESAEDAGDQRICSQAIGAMVLVLAFAAGIQASNVGGLFVIHPEPAHGVVHAGKDFHRRGAWIIAHELLVDFQDAFQLAVENGRINVGEVEKNHRLPINSQPLLVNHLVDGAGGDVARHQIAVLGIPLLQKIPAFALGNRLRIAGIAFFLWYPDAAAFAARRF